MWLTATKSGWQVLFNSIEKPVYDKDKDWWAGKNPIALGPHCISEVTFENSPVEGELKIKEK